MALLADNIRAVFWFAVIPAFIAVAFLLWGVKEPARTQPDGKAQAPIKLNDLKRLGSAYWWIVLVGGVLTLARFSEAFLLLRAEDIGLSITLIPLVLVVMNVVYALSAYPAGYLSDRLQRHTLIGAGFIVLIVADLILALATNIWQVMIGVVFWGLHMGLTHGVLAALVADTSPPELRGSAFGMFNLVSGICLLFASLIAGGLWDRYGAPVPFYAGAIFASIALCGLVGIARYRYRD